MSSNRPVNVRRAWSLRLRLLVGQIVVLAIVCVGIAAATELALGHQLTAQLDQQLSGTSNRAVKWFSEPHPGWRREMPPSSASEPGPKFLDAPGQPAGVVAAVVSHGKT